jgi:hypothetical protein
MAYAQVATSAGGSGGPLADDECTDGKRPNPMESRGSEAHCNGTGGPLRTCIRIASALFPV